MQELVAMRRATESKISALKSELSDIDAAITHLSRPVMTDRLLAANKDHGSLKLVVDGESVQGEIKKTVKWDSDKLKEVASKIPAEDAATIFTVTLSISEEQFDTLTECDHAAIGEILLARTVTFSAFKASPSKEK